MFTATVKGFERFGAVGKDIDAVVLEALQIATEVAAAEAQAGSTTINLVLEVTPAHFTVEGASASIRSGKRGKRGIRLAHIFDAGTLGQHRGKLSHNRRSSWEVTRKGTTYRAHRHAITSEEGISAERFFLRARRMGRKALLARLDRGIV